MRYDTLQEFYYIRISLCISVCMLVYDVCVSV